LKKLQKKPFRPLFAPLAGARFSILQSLGSKYKVDPVFQKKWLLTKFVSIISTGLGYVDRIVWDKKNTKETVNPLFIIGHWRSGTTLLHNAICQSGDVSYTSTYQGVFPNNLFFLKWLFKSIMRLLMPKERPGDGIALNINYPQEEEIALGNEIAYSFYYWFYFPRHTMEFAEKFLLGNAEEQKRDLWRKNYKRFVKRSEANRKGRFYVSKNPPNTFRIEELLEMYPSAKFVFIHRDPYDVFLSCRRFFWETIKGIQLQEISKTDFDTNTLQVYKMMMEKYKETKHTIPKDQLFELSYNELIENPMDEIRNINKVLNLGFDENKLSLVSKYIDKRRDHKVKKYEYNVEDIQLVNAHWTSLLDELNYEKIST
jgi:hypothetical protein